MRIKSKGIIYSILMLILLASIASGAYEGPDKCKTCHAEKYEQWKISLHSKSIVDAKYAIAGGYPVPDDVNQDDLKYTWAGKSKVRWVNNSGYVITGDAVQYNAAEKKFVPYESGQTVGYNCGPCHTTGYDSNGTMFTCQNAYKSGTWKLPGVTCERCHGEGSEHVKAPSKSTIKVEWTAEACDDCHGRTDASIGVTTTSFDPKRRHRVQYNVHLVLYIPYQSTSGNFSFSHNLKTSTNFRNSPSIFLNFL
jgi:cytochrome c553